MTAASLVMSAGGSLTVNSGVTLSPATCSIALGGGGTLTNAGTLTLSAMSWTSGTIANTGVITVVAFSTNFVGSTVATITGAGTFTMTAGNLAVVAGGSLSIANSLSITGAVITAVGAGASIDITGALTFTGGSIAATSGGSISVATGSCSTGSITSDGSSTVNIGAGFTMSQTCFPTAGLVALSGSAALSGTVSVSVQLAASAELTYSAATTTSGAITSRGLIVANAVVTGASELMLYAESTVRVNAGALITTSGQAKLDGKIEVTVTGSAEVKVLGWATYTGTFAEVKVNGAVVTSSSRRLLSSSAVYKADGLYVGAGATSAAAAVQPTFFVALAAAVLACLF